VEDVKDAVLRGAGVASIPFILTLNESVSPPDGVSSGCWKCNAPGTRSGPLSCGALLLAGVLNEYTRRCTRRTRTTTGYRMNSNIDMVQWRMGNDYNYSSPSLPKPSIYLSTH